MAAICSRPTPSPEILRHLCLPAVSVVSPPLSRTVGCGIWVSPVQGALGRVVCASPVIRGNSEAQRGAESPQRSAWSLGPDSSSVRVPSAGCGALGVCDLEKRASGQRTLLRSGPVRASGPCPHPPRGQALCPLTARNGPGGRSRRESCEAVCDPGPEGR